MQHHLTCWHVRWFDTRRPDALAWPASVYLRGPGCLLGSVKSAERGACDECDAGVQRYPSSRGRRRMRSGWTPSVKHTRGQRARVAELQRSRLLKAAVQVASERGYDGMSVTAVVAGARVSRKTFYEFFDGREDCCLAVCEDCLTEIA